MLLSPKLRYSVWVHCSLRDLGHHAAQLENCDPTLSLLHFLMLEEVRGLAVGIKAKNGERKIAGKNCLNFIKTHPQIILIL